VSPILWPSTLDSFGEAKIMTMQARRLQIRHGCDIPVPAAGENIYLIVTR